MMEKKINLPEFRDNLHRLLTAVINRGKEWEEIEAGDLGDMVGRMLLFDEVTTQEELEDLYNLLCCGIHHGIGLSHEHLNTRESIEDIIAKWTDKAK